MKKVYLETPEAVIKALKEGKEVRDDNNYSFKIVDGFIISTDENEFFVGDNISSGYKPYILEEEPFKIEVGKWYKTRDHQKARCYRGDGHLFFFTIDNVGNFSTLINGNYNLNGGTANLDIIGPWDK